MLTFWSIWSNEPAKMTNVRGTCLKRTLFPKTLSQRQPNQHETYNQGLFNVGPTWSNIKTTFVQSLVLVGKSVIRNLQMFLGWLTSSLLCKVTHCWRLNSNHLKSKDVKMVFFLITFQHFWKQDIGMPKVVQRNFVTMKNSIIERKDCKQERLQLTNHGCF